MSVVRSLLTSPRWMARPASTSSEATTQSTSPATGMSAMTGSRPSSLGARARKELQVIDRSAGALRDPGHGGALDDVAARFGDLDEPVGQHPATLPAEGGDRQLERALIHSGADLERVAQTPALAAPLQRADDPGTHAAAASGPSREGL